MTLWVKTSVDKVECFEFCQIKMSTNQASAVPSSKSTGGPHGLGDPDDKSLRKVEMEVMIPKKMRDIAKVEKCFEEVTDFTNCCINSNILMSFKCRNENDKLKACLTRWYQDEDFKKRCTKEYLDQRSEYRRTGISQKVKQRLPASM